MAHEQALKMDFECLDANSASFEGVVTTYFPSTKKTVFTLHYRALCHLRSPLLLPLLLLLLLRLHFHGTNTIEPHPYTAWITVCTNGD